MSAKERMTILKGQVGGCQHDGPFFGTLNIRCRIILGTQKGTIILTTTLVSCARTYFQYCPHPVTVYIRGPIKGYI